MSEIIIEEVPELKPEETIKVGIPERFNKLWFHYLMREIENGHPDAVKLTMETFKVATGSVRAALKYVMKQAEAKPSTWQNS